MSDIGKGDAEKARYWQRTIVSFRQRQYGHKCRRPLQFYRDSFRLRRHRCPRTCLTAEVYCR